MMLTTGYHHWLKRDLKRYSSVAEVMHHLKSRDKKKMYDDQCIAMKRRNIEGSSFQQKLNASHKIKPEDGYETRREGDKFGFPSPGLQGQLGLGLGLLGSEPL